VTLEEQLGAAMAASVAAVGAVGATVRVWLKAKADTAEADAKVRKVEAEQTGAVKIAAIEADQASEHNWLARLETVEKRTDDCHEERRLDRERCHEELNSIRDEMRDSIMILTRRTKEALQGSSDGWAENTGVVELDGLEKRIGSEPPGR
jgi:hypothetical protein